MKLSFSGLTNKKWFSWILLGVLMVSNLISYKIAGDYFSRAGLTDQEEVAVESSVLGSGSRFIDLAREILRFFRNP